MGGKGERGDGGAAGFTGCESSAGELGVDCVRGGDCGSGGDRGMIASSSSNLLSHLVGTLFPSAKPSPNGFWIELGRESRESAGERANWIEDGRGSGSSYGERGD